jgi:hypothetical protein
MIYGDKTNPLKLIYQRAYDTVIDYSSAAGRKLESIVNNRVPKEAIDAANKLMRLAPEGEQGMQILVKPSKDGTVIFEKMPTVQQLDYITRGFNQIASTGEGQGAMGGNTQLGALYKRLSGDIRVLLKELVPEYRHATNAAADMIRSKTARELGETVLAARTKRSDLAVDLLGMGDAEMRKVAEGVRMQIDDAMANVKMALTDTNIEVREAYFMLKNMSSRAAREKLEMVLGREVTETLLAELDRSLKAFELKAATSRNSATHVRRVIDEYARDQIGSGAIDVLREGRPVDAAQTLARNLLGRSAADKARVTDAVYGSLARSLTSNPRPQILRDLAVIPKAVQGIANRRSRLAEDLMRRNVAVTGPAYQGRR